MEEIIASEASWNETKDRLKQKIGMQADNNLSLPEDKQCEMLDKLQAKFGKTKDEIEKLISSL